MYVQHNNIDCLLKSWIVYLNSENSNDSPKDQWLTVPEICKLLRCSEPTIYRKFKNKEIVFSRPAGIMVWLSDIAKYVIQKESKKKTS
ncbi:MAG: helix-turn-helix domain-containing protein [Crocinitomicaceae bacterium]|nr:helix-turn-helix domain-containing protein [Crocinitomicaceae bacterium]